MPDSSLPRHEFHLTEGGIIKNSILLQIIVKDVIPRLFMKWVSQRNFETLYWLIIDTTIITAYVIHHHVGREENLTSAILFKHHN